MNDRVNLLCQVQQLAEVKIANPNFDPELQKEGITCISCHVRTDKKTRESYIIGPNGSQFSPHPVKQDRHFLRDICHRCHNPQGEALTENLLCWFETTKELAVKLKKTPVRANDSPGFISNRILLPMINEAIFALYEDVGTVEAIDSVMKLGMNHPMGPLELADLIGLDTCLSILEVLHEGFGDPKYRPCPLLRKYVDAGYLGRKTNRGFYTY